MEWIKSTILTPESPLVNSIAPLFASLNGEEGGAAATATGSEQANESSTSTQKTTNQSQQQKKTRLTHSIFNHPLLKEKRERANIDAEKMRVDGQAARLDLLLQQQRDILRALAEKGRDQSLHEAWLRFHSPPPTTLFAGRLRSFDSWPLSPKTHPLATPEILAKAGFEFTPSGELRDQVTCCFCFIKLAQWDEKDDPAKLHAKMSPLCPFVLGKVDEKDHSFQIRQRIEIKDDDWTIEGQTGNDDRVLHNDSDRHKLAIVRCVGMGGLLSIIIEGNPLYSLRIDDSENLSLIINSVKTTVCLNRCRNISICIGGAVPSIAVTHSIAVLLSFSVDQMRSDVIMTCCERIEVSDLDATNRQKVSMPKDGRWFKRRVYQRQEDHHEKEILMDYARMLGVRGLAEDDFGGVH